MENGGAEGKRLDCIYNDELLGFMKDPVAPATKMHSQEPLEEINLGDGKNKRSTYISANIDLSLGIKVINLLREYKDCFVCDYNEISGFSRNFMELKLLIKPGKSQSSNF